MSKLLIVPCLLLCYSCIYKGEAREAKPAMVFDRTKMKSLEAFTFCKQKDFDTSICILIDMSLHSGVKRFMVWDFENDTILLSGMVSHGCCNSPWGADLTRDHPVFSNEEGSHCTSLGKYKIGKRGYSNWGIHVNYLMHGLEKENKNALAREIVLHSWENVSDDESYPSGTPEGWGCPAVSNSVMKQVDELLKNRTQPVLMWIYR